MKTITFKELKQKKEKIMNELFGQALSKHYTYLGNLSDNKFKNMVSGVEYTLEELDV